MERHPTDFVRLVFGLAFLAIGGAFIVHQTTDRNFDSAWIAAVGLVTVGCALLAVTLIPRPRRPSLAEPGATPTPTQEMDETQKMSTASEGGEPE
jgi:hypothetical protein